MRRLFLLLLLATLPVSAWSFPLGIPPEEDALVSKIAPDNCLLYFSWYANGSADSASGNTAVAMAADPEMKPIFDLITEQVATQTSAGAGPQFEEAMKIALVSNACFMVTEKDSQPVWSMFVSLGSNPSVYQKQMVAVMNKEKAAKTAEMTFVTISGKKFCQVTRKDSTAGTEQSFFWGFLGKKNEYLLLSGSQSGIESMFANVRTPAPKWLTDAKAELPIKQRSTFCYVNLESFKDIMAETGNADPNSDLTKFLLEASGLSTFNAIIASSGLQGTGMVQKAKFASFGGYEATAMGTLVEGKITEDDLKLIPAGVAGAIIGKTDVSKLLSDIAVAIKDAPIESLPQDIAPMKDLLPGMIEGIVQGIQPIFSDTWAFYSYPKTGKNTPADGCFIAKVKNPPIAKMMLGTLITTLGDNAGGGADGADGLLDGADAPAGGDAGGFQLPPGIQLPPGVTPEMIQQKIKEQGIQIPAGTQLPPGVTPEMIQKEMQKRGIQVPAGTFPSDDSSSINSTNKVRFIGQNIGGMNIGGMGGMGDMGDINPMEMPQSLQFDVEKKDIDGNEVFVLRSKTDETQAMHIAVIGKTLILGTSESVIQRAIDHKSSNSLAKNTTVQKLMDKEPCYLMYGDSSSMYSLLTSTLGSMVPADLLPSEDTMKKYNSTFFGRVYVEKSSIIYESINSLPFPDLILTLIGAGNSAKQGIQSSISTEISTSEEF